MPRPSVANTRNYPLAAPHRAGYSGPMPCEPPNPLPSAPSGDWSALARITELARGPRPDWPATMWPGMAASLGVHGLAVLALVAFGAGWVISLYPPRNDTSSAAARRGSEVAVRGELAPAPDDRTELPVAVKLDAQKPLTLDQQAAIERPQDLKRIAEVEFDAVESSEPAPRPPASSAAQRAAAAHSAQAARADAERAVLPRTARGGAPALPGTVDSRAARGAKSNSPPQAIYSPEPIYPPELLAARRMGRVLLRVRILPAGTVTDAAIYESSRYESFDRAALEAVRQWRFVPLAGAPANGIEAIVPVRFTIVEP